MKAALPVLLILPVLVSGCDSQSQLVISRGDSTFGPITATASVMDMGSTTLMSYIFVADDLPPLIRKGTNREVVLAGRPASLGDYWKPGWLYGNLPPMVPIPLPDSDGYVYFLFQSDQGSRLAKVFIVYDPPFSLGALRNSLFAGWQLSPVS